MISEAKVEVMRSDPVTLAALAYHESVNASGKAWASTEVSLDMRDHVVAHVKVGVIHSDGFVESELKTRMFYRDRYDSAGGEVQFHDSHHR